VKRLTLSVVAESSENIFFVAIGREEHNSGSSIAGVLETAAPFLIALAIGWLATRAWQNPTGVGRGLGIWLVTILAGMNLRHYVFDDGTATSFIIVASVFTLAGLLGWRVVDGRISRDQRSVRFLSFDHEPTPLRVQLSARHRRAPRPRRPPNPPQ